MTGAHAPCCTQLREQLAALEGRDIDEVEHAIAAHLAACPTCTADERQLGELLSRFRVSAAPDLPSDLEARLLDLLCARH